RTPKRCWASSATAQGRRLTRAADEPWKRTPSARENGTAGPSRPHRSALAPALGSLAFRLSRKHLEPCVDGPQRGLKLFLPRLPFFRQRAALRSGHVAGESQAIRNHCFPLRLTDQSHVGD